MFNNMPQNKLSTEEGPNKNYDAYQQRKYNAFPILSIILPILFIFLHHVVLTIMALVRLNVYLVNNNHSEADFLYVLTNPELMEKYFLAADVQNYGSIGAMLILIPIYLLYLHWRKKRHKQILIMPRSSASTYFESIILSMGALGLTQLLMLLLLQFEHADNFFGKALREYLSLSELLTQVETSVWIQLLATVVLVPIGEELLFRGIIQGELALRTSRSTSIIITTLLFSFFHMNIIQGTYVLIAGCCISFAYAFSRNIIVPILMHMAFNFVGGGFLLQWAEDDETFAVILTLLLYLALFLSIFIIRKWVERDKLRRDGQYSSPSI